MSLGSMIVFLFKWVLASITVGVVLGVGIILLAVFLNVLAGLPTLIVPGRGSNPGITR
jgi:hypothetical protein